MLVLRIDLNSRKDHKYFNCMAWGTQY